MKVAICRSAKAYLPETDAYALYLREKGIEARCVENRGDIHEDEIAILFRFDDQVSHKVAARRRVHEYHNYPVGLTGSVRSFLLGRGPRCDARILLEQVERNAPHQSASTLVRPCGIDAALFEVSPLSNPELDLVYCGSLERPGTLLEIERLANKGFRIAVYGRIPPGTAQSRMESAGVRFFGRIGRGDVPAALANARAGLNFTPDRAPWNFQESMKTLEYLAVGLPVVANRYEWAETFARKHETQFLWLDQLREPRQLDEFSPPRVDLREREWSRLLDRVGFVDFLRQVDA